MELLLLLLAESPLAETALAEGLLLLVVVVVVVAAFSLLLLVVLLVVVVALAASSGVSKRASSVDSWMLPLRRGLVSSDPTVVPRALAMMRLQN